MQLVAIHDSQEAIHTLVKLSTRIDFLLYLAIFQHIDALQFVSYHQVVWEQKHADIE